MLCSSRVEAAIRINTYSRSNARFYTCARFAGYGTFSGNLHRVRSSGTWLRVSRLGSPPPPGDEDSPGSWNLDEPTADRWERAWQEGEEEKRRSPAFGLMVGDEGETFLYGLVSLQGRSLVTWTGATINQGSQRRIRRGLQRLPRPVAGFVMVSRRLAAHRSRHRFFVVGAERGWVVKRSVETPRRDPIGGRATRLLQLETPNTPARLHEGTFARTPQRPLQAQSLEHLFDLPSATVLHGCMWPREVLPEATKRAHPRPSTSCAQREGGMTAASPTAPVASLAPVGRALFAIAMTDLPALASSTVPRYQGSSAAMS